MWFQHVSRTGYLYFICMLFIHLFFLPHAHIFTTCDLMNSPGLKATVFLQQHRKSRNPFQLFSILSLCCTFISTTNTFEIFKNAVFGAGNHEKCFTSYCQIVSFSGNDEIKWAAGLEMVTRSIYCWFYKIELQIFVVIVGDFDLFFRKIYSIVSGVFSVSFRVFWLTVSDHCL